MNTDNLIQGMIIKDGNKHYFVVLTEINNRFYVMAFKSLPQKETKHIESINFAKILWVAKYKKMFVSPDKAEEPFYNLVDNVNRYVR